MRLSNYAEQRLLEDAVGGNGFSHEQVYMALLRSFDSYQLEVSNWGGELGTGRG
jgi:hypothetical protein